MKNNRINFMKLSLPISKKSFCSVIEHYHHISIIFFGCLLVCADILTRSGDILVHSSVKSSVLAPINGKLCVDILLIGQRNS